MDGVYLQTQKMQCLQIGRGEKVLFAFHGFGQNPSVFECLRQYLPQYTIYSFDLLSFGKEPTKSEVFGLLEQFCKTHHITFFSILSFSIGSKMALSLLEHFSEQVEKIVLIAPDGFQKNFWYEFATSSIGKQIFWKFIKKPSFFLKIAEFLSKIKFIDTDLLKIAKIYTDNPPKRFLLWRTWLSQKHLFPNHQSLQKIYDEKPIATRIFVSETDKLCPVAPIRNFSKNYRCIKIIDSPTQHHRLLDEILRNQLFLEFLQ